jgi:hypothetical protein
MNAQHTPGPWQNYNSSNGRIYKSWSVCNRDGSRIAKIEQMPGQSSEEEAANARLIASAPDLLEALQDAEFLLRKAGQLAGPMQDSFNRSAADARAAIAKATA